MSALISRAADALRDARRDLDMLEARPGRVTSALSADPSRLGGDCWPSVAHVKGMLSSMESQLRQICSDSSAPPAASLVGGNALKTLEFLRTRISHTAFVRVTQAEIAARVAIAPGAVPFAIFVLKSKGIVEERGRGNYRLL